jgi:hypothetical protein
VPIDAEHNPRPAQPLRRIDTMPRNNRLRTVAYALAAAQVALLVAAALDGVGAQQGAKPAVRVPSVLLVEPEVDTPLGIDVSATDQLPPRSFLRIRGLPQAAKLSEGHIISPGVWAVPLTALAALRVRAPLASSGRTELSLALVSVDGGVIAGSRTSMVVAPAWLLASPSQQAALPPQAASRAADKAERAGPAPSTPTFAALPPPAARSPAARTPPPAAQPPPPGPGTSGPGPGASALSGADLARAEDMFRRGEVFLSQSNVAAARRFYRRTADMGLARAALRLGSTYDPAELPGLRATGLASDPAEARRWYERARQLGAPEAAARLSRLPN